MATGARRRLERLGAVIGACIRDRGWEQRLREEEVPARWEEAVGPQIAAHARAAQVVNGRLTVVTESPVWAQQLALLKPELLRRIARTFGRGVVAELFFVTGRIEPAAPPPPAPVPTRAEPPPELPAALEAECDAIADDELREQVRRACRTSLARQA